MLTKHQLDALAGNAVAAPFEAEQLVPGDRSGRVLDDRVGGSPAVPALPRLHVRRGRPEDLRRIVHTINTIQAMHRQIRKAIKTRGHIPDQQAATKLIYLAIERAKTKWRSARSLDAATPSPQAEPPRGSWRSERL